MFTDNVSVGDRYVQPIGTGLDAFRDSNKSSYDTLNSNESLDILLDLIHALQGVPVSRHLPSSRGGKNLLDDLSKFMTAVNTNNFDIERLIPLLKQSSLKSLTK